MSDQATAPAAKAAEIMQDPGGHDSRNPEEAARWEYADGLRDLARFLEETPGAPLPNGTLARHYNDADEFDRAAAVLGSPITGQGQPYEHCSRKFGPITLDIQTNGRAAQQIAERERRIAERERELGIDDEASS